MKIAAILLCAFGLLFGQEAPQREGNFDIRFEASAKLQTGVEVPFRISVNDARRQPLIQAKVTLQIELTDGTRVKVYPASATAPGVYIAKPVFPVSGEWNVFVEVRRENQVSARTIEFSVPD